MDSVTNVTQVYTVDRSMLVERVGTLPTSLLRVIENGLRIMMELYSATILRRDLRVQVV